MIENGVDPPAAGDLPVKFYLNPSMKSPVAMNMLRFFEPTSAIYHRLFEWCAREKIKTIAAALSERSQNVFEMSMTGSVAIALGSEATGLSLEFQRRCDHLAVIPMRGVCDRLNVSVAGAVFIFEILRQRDSRG